MKKIPSYSIPTISYQIARTRQFSWPAQHFYNRIPIGSNYFIGFIIGQSFVSC